MSFQVLTETNNLNSEQDIHKYRTMQSNKFGQMALGCGVFQEIWGII